MQIVFIWFLCAMRYFRGISFAELRIYLFFAFFPAKARNQSEGMQQLCSTRPHAPLYFLSPCYQTSASSTTHMDVCHVFTHDRLFLHVAMRYTFLICFPLVPSARPPYWPSVYRSVRKGLAFHQTRLCVFASSIHSSVYRHDYAKGSRVLSPHLRFSQRIALSFRFKSASNGRVAWYTWSCFWTWK